MKHSSTLFLKAVLVLLILGALIIILRFPLTEGRAANLDLLSIYTDPLIIFMYIASIPFFVGVFYAFKLLRLIEANKVFTQGAINILGKMKLASLLLIGFIALGVLYIRFIAPHGVEDDPAGPTMLGFLVSFGVAVIATAITIVQKLLQNAVDIKSEHDLTV